MKKKQKEVRRQVQGEGGHRGHQRARDAERTRSQV